MPNNDIVFNTPVTPAERLLAFKRYMQGDFVQHTKDTFGEDIYNLAIGSQLEDMMECIELHIEDLAEQDIQDNEIMDEEEIDDYNDYNDDDLEALLAD